MDRVTKLIDGLTDEEIYMLEEYLKQRKNAYYKPTIKFEIPYKFPSLNEYTNANRSIRKQGGRQVWNGGADLKKQIQRDIGWILKDLPSFTNPVFVKFTWIEGDMKRDWDNVTWAKKFIFDALVEQGKLTNDSRKFVKGHIDDFSYCKGEWKVIVEIKEEADK